MGEARNEEAESASRRRRGSGETTVLAGRSDPYGGLTILISSTDTTDVETFRNQLKDSLFVWTLEGVRGLWLYLPIERADLVPVAVKCGFVYHHALPSYCMLTAWLPRDSPSTIPAYASHYVGVGGLVVSEEGLVLLIQEKFAKGHGCWKLPGGHVEPGEDLGEAVCREVREETGVSVRFRSVLALRHMHHYSFGSSDLYFVCLARPLTRRLQPCPTEIHACTWVPVAELPSFISSSSSAFHCWLVRVCLEALSSGLVIRPLDREASPTSSSALVYTATGGDPRRTGVPADPAGESPDDTDAAGSPRNANTGSPGDNNRGTPRDPLQGSQYTPIERPLETPKDPNTETPRDPNTETPRDPNTETPRDPNTETPRDLNTETSRDPNTETPRDRNTETPRDLNTETSRDPNTETPRDPNTETPRDLNTETPRDPNTETPTQRPLETPSQRPLETPRDP